MADLSQLSQGQLILRRFARHRLAVASLFLLIALYLMALLAPVLAPYSQSWRDTQFGNCPAMPPRFSLADGFYVPAVVPTTDPVTLRRYYANESGRRTPLRFFVAAEAASFCGFEVHWRFFGVDLEAVRKAGLDEANARWFFLGADRFGHDLFSRIVYGSRVSLSIGLIGIAINFVMGITIGGGSGYYGGRLDTFVQRLIEIVSSFPQIPLWLAMAAVVPITWSPLQTYFAITVLLSMLSWTSLARVVRGKILSLREEDYAVAARLLGASDTRILFRHLLPGFTSHIIVALTLNVPQMIIGETALSFLGLGLRPPVVSWGVLLQDCLNLQAVATFPWLLMPAIFIMLTVLAFNFLGDGLRDAADPYN